jgi:hypothetical protein
MGRKSYLEKEVTENHMKLTEYDCYQSVTEYIHKKCFDLQVCFFFKFFNFT